METLKNVQEFLENYSLHWGMILLYVWVIGIGVFYFWRYQRKVNKGTDDPSKAKTQFKALVKKLQNIQDLLNESDSNAEEAQKLFDEVQNTAETLVKKHGMDKVFDRYYTDVNGKLERAFARLEMSAEGSKRVERFMRQHSGKGSAAPPSGGDELL